MVCFLTLGLQQKEHLSQRHSISVNIASPFRSAVFPWRTSHSHEAACVLSCQDPWLRPRETSNPAKPINHGANTQCLPGAATRTWPHTLAHNVDSWMCDGIYLLLWNHLILRAQNFMVWRGCARLWTLKFVDFQIIHKLTNLNIYFVQILNCGLSYPQNTRN